jgi:hypothetical protein
MAAIVGFIPWLDRRLSILIKSGTAAKVVPKPATKPNTSDRWNPGKSRLDVSWRASPSQPLSMSTLVHKRLPINLLKQSVVIAAVLCGDVWSERGAVLE